MQISNVLKSLFRPNDGSQRAVAETVNIAIDKTNLAASNLQTTIAEFIRENERLKRNVNQLRKQ
jgi:hypothetical protein